VIRLIPYELQKLFKNRSFLLSIAVLFFVHLFLFWYLSLPTENESSLHAYHLVQETLSLKNDEEKKIFLQEWKQEIEGVRFVSLIQSMKQSGDSDAWIQQELANHPGVFEQYLTLYQSGKYLRFCDTLEQEQSLLEEIWQEYEKVSGYPTYLDEIKKNKQTLSNVSVFREKTNDFSSRNIEKSAHDYASLDTENVSFQPSKSVAEPMHALWIDLLLFISVLVAADTLITKEKEKQLFYITHGTKNGKLPLIGAKISALLIHCVGITVLFYGSALLFYGCLTGFVDVQARVQSLACFMDSSFDMRILTFLIVSILTKATVLFIGGVFVLLFCIKSRYAWSSFLFGAGVVVISILVYAMIPAVSSISFIRYLTPVSWLDTNALYGGYLNLSLFQYPISRWTLSLYAMFGLGALVILYTLLSYYKMKHFSVKHLRLPFHISFTPHDSLVRHEAYKLFVAGGALLVFVIFASLLAFRCMDETYVPSGSEQYYQDMMLQLEGEITQEKETLIEKERQRFADAMKIMEQTDSKSALDYDAPHADAAMTLLFYPAFQRVEEQYAKIKQHGGNFVYDSGYRYWFDLSKDIFAINALIITIVMILITSAAIPLEYQSGVLSLIHTSKVGKRRVMIIKGLLCLGAGVLLTLLPLFIRFLRIQSVYPMHMMHTNLSSVSDMPSLLKEVPLWFSMCLLIITHIVFTALIILLTMWISVWRKHQAQTMFFAFVMLGTPMIFYLLGFDVFQWLSFLPLYLWPSL